MKINPSINLLLIVFVTIFFFVFGCSSSKKILPPKIPKEEQFIGRIINLNINDTLVNYEEVLLNLGKPVTYNEYKNEIVATWTFSNNNENKVDHKYNQRSSYNAEGGDNTSTDIYTRTAAVGFKAILTFDKITKVLIKKNIKKFG